MRPSSRLSLSLGLLFCASLTACEAETVSLQITVRTDYVPGVEIFHARTAILGEGGEEVETAYLGDEDYYAPGRRIAELEGLAPSELRRLRVTLEDAAGEPVNARDVWVDNRTSLALTVVMARDCEHVFCTDGAADDTSTCSGGRCVSPSCVEGSLLGSESCPEPECVADADCAGGSACATPRCVQGLCTLAASSTACGPTEICHPEQGCQPEPIRLGTPRLLSPWNGQATGSSRADGPLRPTLRWTPVAEAEEYEVALDSSCATEGFRACPFGSPVLEERTTQTTFRPAAPLPIATVAPVGRRYFVRVRACAAEGCGPWSEPRYLDVGRQRGDINGDGLQRLLGASPYEGGRGAVPYLATDGGYSLVPPLTDQAGQGFGAALAYLGDVDADGFPELAVASPMLDVSGREDEGAVYVYYGGSAGPSAPAGLTLGHPASLAGARFGRALADTGDINGDGFSDLLVGAALDTEGGEGGAAFLYYGGPDGLESEPTELRPEGGGEGFGATLAGAGDFDGDGYGDLVVGAPRYGGVALAGQGAFYVYYGSPLGPQRRLTGLARRRVHPSPRAGAELGSALDLGDFNADGYTDLAVGAREPAGIGSVLIYYGSAEGISMAPARVIESPDAQAESSFGASLATVDLQADGFDELVIGAPTGDRGLPDQGVIYIYYGSAAGIAGAAPDHNLALTDQAGSELATTMMSGDIDGDGFGDLLLGTPGYNPVGRGVDHGVVWIQSGAAGGIRGAYWATANFSPGARLGEAMAH